MDRKFESTCFSLKASLFIIIFSLGTTLLFVNEVKAGWNNSTGSITFSQPTPSEVSVSGTWRVSSRKIIPVSSTFDFPNARFTFSPSFPTEGDTVTFDASDSSDFDGTIVSFDWDFGDGDTGTGVLVTHSYSTGRYTVVLTVTDNDGNEDTAIKTVDIDGEWNWDSFPLWGIDIIITIIGGITIVGGIIILVVILVILKKRKPKDVIPSPAKKTEEELKATDMIHLKEMKEFPELSAKCSDTIALLNGYIEDPTPANDRKAWKAFRELVSIVEQCEGEFAELMEIRNSIAILRRNRDEDRRAGRDELADEAESDIQNNYVESIRIIREIQKNLP